MLTWGGGGRRVCGDVGGAGGCLVMWGDRWMCGDSPPFLESNSKKMVSPLLGTQHFEPTSPADFRLLGGPGSLVEELRWKE